MTNPTLIAQETPWTGFTLDSIVEALLAMRGLTNDATTGRTVAITSEDLEAKRFIREAIDDLHAKFPSVYSIQNYTVTWTAGDHSIVLPQNFASLLAVTFNGLSMAPLSRDDYYRILRSDEEGGGVYTEDQGTPRWYRLVGIADNDAGVSAGDTDYRVVLRLYPTPTEAKSLVVEYVTQAVAVANDEDTLPLTNTMQRWVLRRAAELWAGDRNDSALLQTAERERAKVEESLYSWFDGMRDRPSRLTIRYPHVRRHTRFRR